MELIAGNDANSLPDVLVANTLWRKQKREFTHRGIIKILVELPPALGNCHVDRVFEKFRIQNNMLQG